MVLVQNVFDVLHKKKKKKMKKKWKEEGKNRWKEKNLETKAKGEKNK